MADPPLAQDILTRVQVQKSSSGPPQLTLQSGLLSPRVLGVDGSHVRVALIATTALLLAGDAVYLEVSVGPDCRLDLTDVAGTVAYGGGGEVSRWQVRLRLGPGAVLTWPSEPFVVSADARVERELDARLGTGARALLRDVLVLGRAGQPSGDLLCRTRVEQCTDDGQSRPLLIEDLALDQSTARLPGMLGPGAGRKVRVLDTVTALGWHPPLGESDFDLALPGAVSRTLAESAHTTTGRSTYEHWRATLA